MELTPEKIHLSSLSRACRAREDGIEAYFALERNLYILDDTNISTLEASAGQFQSISFWLSKYEQGESNLYGTFGLEPSVAVKHVKITSISTSMDVSSFTYSKYSIVSRSNQLLGFWRQGGAISVDVISEHPGRSHPNGK